MKKKYILFICCFLWKVGATWAQPWHELKIDLLPPFGEQYTLSYEYQWKRNWSANLTFQTIDHTDFKLYGTNGRNIQLSGNIRQEMAMLALRGYLMSRNYAHGIFLDVGVLIASKPRADQSYEPFFYAYPHGLSLPAGIGYKLTIWHKLVFEPSITMYRNQILLFSPLTRDWTRDKTRSIVFLKLGYRFSHS